MDNNLTLHIRELHEALAVKGYDGYFQCGDYMGKIPECLNRYMMEQSSSRSDLQDAIAKFSTYTEWQPDEPQRDSDSMSTVCTFNAVYDCEKGFILTSMEFVRQFGARTVSHFIQELRTKDDIPLAKEINKIANDIKLIREYSRQKQPKVLKRNR